MLTCPAKVAFEEAGGDIDNPPPEYNAGSYARDPYKQPEQWSRSEPSMPRKRQRRPKVPKTQGSVRSALDTSVHTGSPERQFYQKMQMEPPPPFPPPPPAPPTLPPFQPQPAEPQEQKMLHHQLLQSAELQQLILQREQELIKQERLILQQEEQVQLECQVAQEVPQQEEVVPPPLAVVESAIVTQEDILNGGSVSDVAANVAISTEPAPMVETPKKRKRSFKGRTSSTEMKLLHEPPVPDAPFIPEPQLTPPKPIKVEEKPKSGTRKRKLSNEGVHQTLTRGTLNRIEQNQVKATKSKQEEQQALLPDEISGSKINYATTSITTENVIPYKRHKKRPNYAAMNDDSEDGKSQMRKSDVSVATPDVPPPRSKRTRTSVSTPQQEEDDDDINNDLDDDDDDDDDSFTPKHVSRRAAKLKQETIEPGKLYY